MNGSDLVELEEQGKQYEDLFDVDPENPNSIILEDGTKLDINPLEEKEA